MLAQTVGNTVAVVAAALLLRRLTGGRGDLERVTDVLSLVACALVAALISAAFGPLSLRLGDVIPADESAGCSAPGPSVTPPACSFSRR